MSKLPACSISDLLDAGVHFGHKTARWNPKMAPYIYGVKDNIHIVDLQQTLPMLYSALNEIFEVVKNNGKVLFVGTKIQATEIIAEYAEKCGQYYVNHRWLGGMITNWGTVSRSIRTLDNLEKTLDDEELAASYTKKERLELTRKKDKLLKSLGGIRNMGGKPDLIVVIDTNKEKIAIQEAQKLNIPVVAIVDTNSNPDNIEFPVPGNDDAIRSIKLYLDLAARAALAGIEESLTRSGVDLGESAEGANLTSVKPLKNQKAKAKPVAKAPAKKAEVKTDEVAETEKNPAAKKTAAKKAPAKDSEKKTETKKAAGSKA